MTLFPIGKTNQILRVYVCFSGHCHRAIGVSSGKLAHHQLKGARNLVHLLVVGLNQPSDKISSTRLGSWDPKALGWKSPNKKFRNQKPSSPSSGHPTPHFLTHPQQGWQTHLWKARRSSFWPRGHIHNGHGDVPTKKSAHVRRCGSLGGELSQMLRMTKKWSSEELSFAYWNFVEIVGNEAVFMIVFFEGISWDGKKIYWKKFEILVTVDVSYIFGCSHCQSQWSQGFLWIPCCNPIVAVTGRRSNQLRFPRSFLPEMLPEISAFF